MDMDIEMDNVVLPVVKDQADNEDQSDVLADGEHQSNNSGDIFCFETDHVALKGNPDYQELLQTVALLQSQRTQAIKHLDHLYQVKEDALADPIAFVHKLQQKVDLGLPGPQKLATLPPIQWEKYSSNIESYMWSHKHRTRFKKQKEESTSVVSSRSTTPTSSWLSPEASTSQQHPSPGQQEMSMSSDTAVNDDNAALYIVRGKVKNETKPTTFNRLWTEEEQRRLEELLIKFPTEGVEARRWEKIANELGNRTKFQVQSRMQKYLIRLASEGLPLPGRQPHAGSMQKRRIHLHQKHNRFLFPQSTMSASYRPPVFMSDDDDDSGGAHQAALYEGRFGAEYIDVSEEEDVPMEMRSSDEYYEIMRLKREKKRQEMFIDGSRMQHVGFSCDACGCDPISGTRWHCSDCPEEYSVDFCDNCSDFVYETDHHSSDHHLSPIKDITSHHHHDDDYQHSSFIPGDYNYLDPNYMPAT